QRLPPVRRVRWLRSRPGHIDGKAGVFGRQRLLTFSGRVGQWALVGTQRVSSRWPAISDNACAAFAAVAGLTWSNTRSRTLARCTGHAFFSFASPAGVSLAMLPRPSSVLERLVTNPLT